jgi:Tol biopolymer transport system component
LKTSGEPTVIAERVDASPRGAAYSVSRNGTIVYSPTTEQTTSRLVWMDREGRALSQLGDEADYSNVELSPDGRRVLVSVTDTALRTRDIYIIDVARGVRQRLTFDPSDERSAAWSPDGRRVVYNSKGLDLYMRPSDFSGDGTPVASSAWMPSPVPARPST